MEAASGERADGKTAVLNTARIHNYLTDVHSHAVWFGVLMESRFRADDFGNLAPVLGKARDTRLPWGSSMAGEKKTVKNMDKCSKGFALSY